MNIILEKILVAVDFSEHAEEAVDQAMLLAAGSESVRLVLLWVDTRLAMRLAPAGEIASVHPDALETSQVHAEIGGKMAALVARAAGHGVEIETRIDRGHADETIVRVAEEIGAALVVVGTHGRTGFKRLLLGSVAEKVVRTSHTNVLVVRGPVREFKRVLVATDFSPASEHALQLALALAPQGAHVDIVHAWHYPPGTRGLITPDAADGPLAGVRKEVLRRTQKLGEGLVNRYSRPDQTVSFEPIFGAPAQVVHERLDEGGYDLVAMGTHGHRGFRRFLLGSVAEATVRHAPCAVLVTHDLGRDDQDEE